MFLQPGAIGVMIEIVAGLTDLSMFFGSNAGGFFSIFGFAPSFVFEMEVTGGGFFCAGVCEASCTVGGREASGWAGDFSGSVCARRQIAPNEQSVTTRSCLIIFLAKPRRAIERANAFRSDAAVGWF